MISDGTREHWQYLADELALRADLTDWEIEFVDSTITRLAGGKDLTWKWSKRLREVAARYHIE